MNFKTTGWQYTMSKVRKLVVKEPSQDRAVTTRLCRKPPLVGAFNFTLLSGGKRDYVGQRKIVLGAR